MSHLLRICIKLTLWNQRLEDNSWQSKQCYHNSMNTFAGRIICCLSETLPSFSILYSSCSWTLSLRSSFFARSGLISSLLHSVWKWFKKSHLPPYKFCLLFRENVHIWIFEAKNFKVPELLPSKFKWDLFWGFANTAFFVLLEYYYPLYNFISSSASVFNSLWLHLINRECLTLLFCSNALILSSNSKRCKVETLSLLFPFSYFFFVFIWWNLCCWLNLTF